MEEYCFQPESSKLPKMSTDTYHSFLLAMGGVLDTLNRYGHTERTHEILDKIHDMVGLHGRYTVSHFSYAPLLKGPDFFTKMLQSNILYDNLLIDILSV